MHIVCITPGELFGTGSTGVATIRLGVIPKLGAEYIGDPIAAVVPTFNVVDTSADVNNCIAIICFIYYIGTLHYIVCL
jgi:hypothetical protein